MKNIVSILVGITFTVGAFSQTSKLKKADDFYVKVAYAEALLLYTDQLGSTVDGPQMKAKLANCYYQIGETFKAEELYSKMITTNTATSLDIYNYAQSLKENGKYTESDKWMTTFYLKEAEDSRGKQLFDNKVYVQQIESQGEYFSIKHLKVNTANTDFGGYPMGKGTVCFISNRQKNVIQRFHAWNDKPFLDIYQATVNSTNEFEDVDLQSRKVNKKFHEGPLCFSTDAKTVYYTRNNMSGGKDRRNDDGIQCLKMYVAEIDDEGRWINEKEVEVNSKDYSTGHPTLSPDGKTLYFVSNMPGGFGGADIYKVEINEDGTYGKPENLGEKVNTEGQEMFPWMNNEGVLFFSSDGHLGLGGLDVYAMLPRLDGTLNKLMNLGKPINSSKDDFAMIMNIDNTTGYVSSNRADGIGDDDIYSFTLLKPLQINLSIKGAVIDVRSNQIILGATVNLLNEHGNVLATAITNDKGEYEFVGESGIDYTIEVIKDDYFDYNIMFSTKNLNAGVELIEKDVPLVKDPGLMLYTLIVDTKSKEPIDGVSVKITDNLTGAVFADFITEESEGHLKGLEGKKIDDLLSFKIEISKEGFFSKLLTFNYKIVTPGVINVHELIEGGLSMDAVVTNLTNLIEINPINFDLNKAVIRPDAKKELDKIVMIMNEYPKMEVELGSYTDCRASKAYNRKLSDRRARASAAYIKSKITNPERIYGKGYGESRSLNGCECEGDVKPDCSEEEHEMNRRTEFKVISMGEMIK